MTPKTDMGRLLDEVIADFPAGAHADLRADIPRTVEAVEWLGDSCRSVLDIGGGHSLFAPLCAMLGMRAVVTDTFEHPYYGSEVGRRDRDIIERRGVEFVRHDAGAGEPLPFADDTFDAVTSFDSLEHWHHSPRGLFREVRRVAAPGGIVALGTPNAVNLRKRIAVLAGRTNWSRFEDWYEEPVFFGHVREPTVADFERIAEDIGLVEWRVVGRNWLGYRRDRLGQIATSVIDRPLRLSPVALREHLRRRPIRGFLTVNGLTGGFAEALHRRVNEWCDEYSGADEWQGSV